VLLAAGGYDPNLAPFLALIALGFVIGIFGHIIKSRPMIIFGIFVIGTLSMIYVFVIGPRGH
jgi:hypothetical protein